MLQGGTIAQIDQVYIAKNLPISGLELSIVIKR